MQALDASSAIYGWDNYPLGIFPKLWEWLAESIGAAQFCICDAAMAEIQKKSPECCAWLVAAGISIHQPTGAILAEALRIKELLRIQSDNYHPNGVGENDILIIATSKVMTLGLVSNESVQVNPPIEARKSKIPRVCAMNTIGVPCIDFLQLLKSSGMVFT